MRSFGPLLAGSLARPARQSSFWRFTATSARAISSAFSCSKACHASASTTSAATFIINPGLVAYFGLSAVFALCLVLPLSMFVSLVVMTKGFRKYGVRSRVLTVPQWIGERYG